VTRRRPATLRNHNGRRSAGSSQRRNTDGDPRSVAMRSAGLSQPRTFRGRWFSSACTKATSESREGGGELGGPRPARREVERQTSRTLGEPSDQSEQAPREGLGRHDPGAQAESAGPASRGYGPSPGPRARRRSRRTGPTGTWLRPIPLLGSRPGSARPRQNESRPDRDGVVSCARPGPRSKKGSAGNRPQAGALTTPRTRHRRPGLAGVPVAAPRR
jgi:hypothetical protein